MTRLAYQALMMWDDPRQFEHQLLEHLVASSMEAVGNAIKNNPDSDSLTPMVEMLEDLLMLTNEIT